MTLALESTLGAQTTNRAVLDIAPAAGDVTIMTQHGVSIDANGHIVCTSAGLPTFAAGAGLGTTPPTPTVTGNDTRMKLVFGTGSSTPAGGTTGTFTFANAYPAAPFVVGIVPANAATAAITGTWYVVSTSATTVVIGFSGTLTASQGATVYAVELTLLG